MAENPYTFLVDPTASPSTAQPAPATNRPGQALYTSPPQAGIVGLGSDYGATAKAQAIKTDANGSQYVVSATPAGTATFVGAGTAPGALSGQYGVPSMVRQDVPTPSAWQPCLADADGFLKVHPSSKKTWRLIAAGITLGTNVILAAIFNGSSSILRVNDCAILIPPAGGVSGALLSSSNGLSYYPVYCEIRRVPSFSGGTTASMVPMDPADTQPSGLTAAIKPTGVGTVSATIHRQDAYLTNVTGLPFYSRGDSTGKTIVVRPGDGLCIVCTSNGTVNSSTVGGGTVTASADLLMTMTTAAG